MSEAPAQEDWRIAYQFTQDLADFLVSERGYEPDGVFIRSLRMSPEEYKVTMWDGMSEEVRTEQLRGAEMGAQIWIEAYERSPKARAIDKAIERARRGEFDPEIVADVKRTMAEIGSEFDRWK